MQYRVLILLCCLFVAIDFVSAEESQKPKDASHVSVIEKNSKLSQVLDLLKENGVEVSEVFRAVASDDSKKRLREYVIHPEFRHKDAVFITFESDAHKDNYVVKQLSWHCDWAKDSLLPYSLRGNKILYLDFLDIDILPGISTDIKRQRKLFKPSDENPFDRF